MKIPFKVCGESYYGVCPASKSRTTYTRGNGQHFTVCLGFVVEGTISLFAKWNRRLEVPGKTFSAMKILKPTVKFHGSSLATLLLLGSFLLAPALAQANPFCRDVMDSFDFERRVFAGPDPDILPNRIHQYIRVRIEHQVSKRQLTRKEADFLVDSTHDELHLLQSIAEACQREPGSEIRLIDRLLAPYFHSDRLSGEMAATANRKAHETLDALWQSCQVFWMEQESDKPCTLDGMTDENGKPFFLPEGLEVSIENGSLTGFRARAWHRGGNREYLMNAQGDIFETAIPEKQDQ